MGAPTLWGQGKKWHQGVRWEMEDTRRKLWGESKAGARWMVEWGRWPRPLRSHTSSAKTKTGGQRVSESGFQLFRAREDRGLMWRIMDNLQIQDSLSIP